MARHQEIERKFLVATPPPGLRRAKSARIVQGYLPLSSRGLEIRLRRKNTRCFLTIKRGRGARRLEEEIKIPAPQFRSLWPLTREARIAKRRVEIPWQGCTIELDLYEGPHRGLITPEVEFETERASRSFQPPAWFGREITGRPSYSNAQLARRQRAPTRG